jgi:hypothetical protein
MSYQKPPKGTGTSGLDKGSKTTKKKVNWTIAAAIIGLVVGIVIGLII